jgi:hypothetical protein
MAASRKSKLLLNANNPTSAKPRLAKPTSNWKGLSSHDEAGRQFPEKNVQDEIVEVCKSDREQHEIREQRFDDQRRAARWARPPKRDGGSEQAQHKKRQREVAEDERNDVPH